MVIYLQLWVKDGRSVVNGDISITIYSLVSYLYIYIYSWTATVFLFHLFLYNVYKSMSIYISIYIYIYNLKRVFNTTCRPQGDHSMDLDMAGISRSVENVQRRERQNVVALWGGRAESKGKPWENLKIIGKLWENLKTIGKLWENSGKMEVSTDGAAPK